MKSWMEQGLKAFLRAALLATGRLIARTILNMTVVGRENLPREQPVIVVSNHFSWFDGGLITITLPFRPVFIVAAESQRYWFFRVYMYAFGGIAIQRGRADRKALREALDMLRSGRAIGIFPEGGINPQFAAQRAHGDAIEVPLKEDFLNNACRRDGELTHPQAGVAFLAVSSGAPILPVALIGTHQIVANLLARRRTRVTFTIGPLFGPLTVDDGEDKADRRRKLDAHAETFMHHIAALMPPENRGPYRDL